MSDQKKSFEPYMLYANQEEFFNTDEYKEELEQENNRKIRSEASSSAEYYTLNFTLSMLACFKHITRSYLMKQFLTLLRLSTSSDNQAPIVKQMLIVTGLIFFFERTFFLLMEQNLENIDRNAQVKFEKLADESKNKPEYKKNKFLLTDARHLKTSLIIINAELIGDLIIGYAPLIISAVIVGAKPTDIAKMAASKFKLLFGNAMIGSLISLGALVINAAVKIGISKLQEYIKAENEIRNKQRIFQDEYAYMAKQIGIYAIIEAFFNARIEDSHIHYGGSRMPVFLSNGLSYVSNFVTPAYKLLSIYLNKNKSSDAINALPSLLDLIAPQKIHAGNQTMWASAFDQSTKYAKATFNGLRSKFTGYVPPIKTDKSSEYTKEILPDHIYITTGPSGSGKSMLLARLAGEAPESFRLLENIKQLEGRSVGLLNNTILSGLQSLLRINEPDSYNLKLAKANQKLMQAHEDLESLKEQLKQEQDSAKKVELESKINKLNESIPDLDSTAKSLATLTVKGSSEAQKRFQTTRVTIGQIRKYIIPKYKKELEMEKKKLEAKLESDGLSLEQINAHKDILNISKKIENQEKREEFAKKILDSIDNIKDMKPHESAEAAKTANDKARENSDIGYLSDGQFFRVMFAVQMASKLDVLCVDEKMSNLDAPKRTEILRIIAESINAKLGITFMIADHNMLPEYKNSTSIDVVQSCEVLQQPVNPNNPSLGKLEDYFGFIQISNGELNITQAEQHPQMLNKYQSASEEGKQEILKSDDYQKMLKKYEASQQKLLKTRETIANMAHLEKTHSIGH